MSFAALRWLASKVWGNGVLSIVLSLCVLFSLTIVVILTLIKTPEELISERLTDLSVERVVLDELPKLTFMMKVGRFFTPER